MKLAITHKERDFLKVCLHRRLQRLEREAALVIAREFEREEPNMEAVADAYERAMEAQALEYTWMHLGLVYPLPAWREGCEDEAKGDPEQS